MDFIERLLSFFESHLLLSSSFCILLFLCIRYEQKKAGKVLSVQEMITLMNRQEAVVIDLRKEEDFSKGHIRQSIHIPFSLLKERQSQLPKSLEHPIIMVCQYGQYSKSSTHLLKQLGYTNVSSLKAGISQWQAENLPLSKPEKKSKTNNKKQKKEKKTIANKDTNNVAKKAIENKDIQNEVKKKTSDDQLVTISTTETEETQTDHNKNKNSSSE